MTEYEAASLVVQQATLDIQTASLAIQEASLAIQEAALTVQWAQVGISGLQTLLIAGGLWLMNRASILRNKQLDQQHEETMFSLRALIERTAPQQG